MKSYGYNLIGHRSEHIDEWYFVTLKHGIDSSKQHAYILTKTLGHEAFHDFILFISLSGSV